MPPANSYHSKAKPTGLIPLLGLLWMAFFFSLSLSVLFRNILTPYDLSYDELYSALTVSSGDFLADLLQWILPDTHPPLHAALLFAWSGVFGGSEVSLRLLSATMSIATLLVWIAFAFISRFLPLYLGFPFLALNPYFLFFSNEVRGYSCLILSSTLVLFSLLIRHGVISLAAVFASSPLRRLVVVFASDAFFFFSLLQVSLVHYYGLFFAIVVLGLDLFLRRRVSILLLGGFPLLFVWPLFHLVLFGSGQSERVSWLRHSPLYGPLSDFSDSNLPHLRIYQLSLILFSLVLLAIPRISDAISRRYSEVRLFSGAARLGLILFFMFISFIIGIDSVVPLSLDKYFVVLLPTTSLLLGISLSLPLLLFIRLSVPTLTVTLLPLALFVAFSAEAMRGLWASSKFRVDSKVSFLASRTFAYLRKTGACEKGCFVSPGLMRNSESGDSRGMVLTRYALRDGFVSRPGSSGLPFLFPLATKYDSVRTPDPTVYLAGFDLGGSLARRDSNAMAAEFRLPGNGYQCFWIARDSAISIWMHKSVLPLLNPLGSGFSRCSSD